jgi:hypothetical protein
MSSALPTTPTPPHAEPAVEFAGVYYVEQNNFRVKFSDDGKPIVIRYFQDVFDVSRVVLDTKIPNTNTTKKIFIDNTAGDSWLRELVMLEKSRSDLDVRHYIPNRQGEFGDITIKPKQGSPVYFFGHPLVTCITIQYNAERR